MLHSEQCWEGRNFCSRVLKKLDTNEKSTLDENEVIHGQAKTSGSVGEDGVIFWLAVRGLMIGTS